MVEKKNREGKLKNHKWMTLRQPMDRRWTVNGWFKILPGRPPGYEPNPWTVQPGIYFKNYLYKILFDLF
jgi:hypothetical protein